MSAKCLGNEIFTIIGQYSYFESKTLSFIKLVQFNDKLDNTIFLMPIYMCIKS